MTAESTPAPANKPEPAAIVGTYDGIEENNHPLPGWWQWTLYGAIAVAAVYWFAYQGLHVPSLRQQYLAQSNAEKAARAQNALAQGNVNADVLVGLSKDPATVSKGQAVFTATCAACHRADGGGNIGPNLTDAYWLHGGKPENIYSCAHDGVTTKGMPAWGPVLGDEKVAQAVAYVLTIRNTNVPNGKAPQGEKED